MVIPLIQMGANLLAGALAAYTDWKTGYIYDWITYPLIGLGIILSLLTQNWLGIVLGAGIYLIGKLAYRTGKIGGGDIKLLAGIALVQPVFGGMLFPLVVLLVATLLASIVFGFVYVGQLWKTRPRIEWKKKKWGKTMVYLLVTVGALTYMAINPIFPLLAILIFALALGSGLLYQVFEDEIKAKQFLQHLSVETIEEDEVVAIEHLDTKTKTKWGGKFPTLIGPTEAKRLKQLEIHTIPVYRNLPRFGPFLFLGMVIAYLLPEWGMILFPLGWSG
ncbi:MAG: A24 family peptidase [Candidatus Diapherotrites archaeon]|nr:A24 family peptidase [Candidatus Diapherotrites archaeon]MDZ4256809.1 A24 family peptidase [archaeon]